jgi:hypothetical protein
LPGCPDRLAAALISRRFILPSWKKRISGVADEGFRR